jgi:hypothetical protein
LLRDVPAESSSCDPRQKGKLGPRESAFTPAVDQPKEFLRATKFRESLPLVALLAGAIIRICKMIRK